MTDLMADVKRKLVEVPDHIKNSEDADGEFFPWAVFMAFGDGFQSQSGKEKPWPLHMLRAGHSPMSSHAGNSNKPFYIASSLDDAMEYCEWARKVLYTDEGRSIFKKYRGHFINRLVEAIEELSGKEWL